MSPIIKNFLITGKKQVGKSYLIKMLISELGLTCSGFQTLPYYIGEERKGFYFHSFEETVTYENNLPVNVQTGKDSCIGIGQIFSTLGIECLNSSIFSNRDCIVMDELGKIERDEQLFHLAVSNVLDSEKPVLAVIKKETIAWLELIKKRKDVIVYDLDELPQQKVLEEIKQKVEDILATKNKRSIQ